MAGETASACPACGAAWAHHASRPKYPGHHSLGSTPALARGRMSDCGLQIPWALDGNHGIGFGPEAMTPSRHAAVGGYGPAASDSYGIGTLALSRTAARAHPAAAGLNRPGRYRPDLRMTDRARW